MTDKNNYRQYDDDRAAWADYRNGIGDRPNPSSEFMDEKCNNNRSLIGYLNFDDNNSKKMYGVKSTINNSENYGHIVIGGDKTIVWHMDEDVITISFCGEDIVSFNLGGIVDVELAINDYTITGHLGFF